MMTNAEWIEKSTASFMNTYGRYPAVMVEGKGCLLKDGDGREYLDCLAGIAVCSLGHCHPAITEAICRQASTLVHVSNLYHTMPQTELAELLLSHSFADRVFLCNSGAEANEAAIKLAGPWPPWPPRVRKNSTRVSNRCPKASAMRPSAISLPWRR